MEKTLETVTHETVDALRILQEGIDAAEGDMQSDSDAGERVDLFDYEISLPYETAREIAALLRSAAPPQHVRAYPDLMSVDERKSLLAEAENLWRDLHANNLGGFSGVNRPFYILHEFKRVIEKYGRRDVGLTWSNDDIERHTTQHANR